jgi:hypothetical protein
MGWDGTRYTLYMLWDSIARGVDQVFEHKYKVVLWMLASVFVR